MTRQYLISGIISCIFITSGAFGMEQITTAENTQNTANTIDQPQSGDIFKHYKGKLYKVICISRHSEDLTWHVVYEALYDNAVSKVWHRPLEMFMGTLEIDGKETQRFEKIIQ